MADLFEDCMMLMLHHEGMDLERGKTGFVMDPHDNDGGATNFGITKITYQEFKGREVTIDEMKNMPFSDVQQIYKEKYVYIRRFQDEKVSQRGDQSRESN